MQLWYDSLLIALGVLIPAAIYAGPKIRDKRKKEREERAALEEKRDETLESLCKLLANLSSDMRCLYEIQIPQLDVIEVTLLSLRGEKINGNVTDALKKINATKQTINDHLTGKIGSDIGKETD